MTENPLHPIAVANIALPNIGVAKTAPLPKEPNSGDSRQRLLKTGERICEFPSPQEGGSPLIAWTQRKPLKREADPEISPRGNQVERFRQRVCP